MLKCFVRIVFQVYDGSSEKAMMICKYCSKRPPDVIASSARDMFVHFQSHSQTSGEGFEAVYTQSAGNVEIRYENPFRKRLQYAGISM